MSDFKAKMHHIPFRLGLRPIPRLGSLPRSPIPPSWIKGPTFKGRHGRGGRKGGRERWRRGLLQGLRGIDAPGRMVLAIGRLVRIQRDYITDVELSCVALYRALHANAVDSVGVFFGLFGS